MTYKEMLSTYENVFSFYCLKMRNKYINKTKILFYKCFLLCYIYVYFLLISIGLFTRTAVSLMTFNSYILSYKLIYLYATNLYVLL